MIRRVRAWFAAQHVSPFPDDFLPELRAERRAVGASLRRRRAKVRRRLQRGAQ